METTLKRLDQELVMEDLLPLLLDNCLCNEECQYILLCDLLFKIISDYNFLPFSNPYFMMNVK